MRTLLARAGVDRPVFFGILSKIATAAFSLLTLVLIAWRLAPEVQGYYYTFLNLVALQVFAEFGLGIVIVQVASHLWASLDLDGTGRIVGNAEAHGKLADLARKSFTWYRIAGVAAVVGIGITGVFFFRSAKEAGIRWERPWGALCLLVGLKMWLIPVWSLLEGCNQVASLYRYRFQSAVISGVCTGAALWGGLGLWSPVAGIGGEVLFAVIYLWAFHLPFFRSLSPGTLAATVQWRREILPLQARIAGSWISGYFITALFTPALFHLKGARVAGQWGMTWSMFAMVTSISQLWITTRGPQFGVWIARREFERLDREFLKLLWISSTLAVVGVSLVWTGLWLLPHLRPSLAERVLAPLPAAFLAVAVAATSIPFAQSVYLRAHAREPLTGMSVLQAVFTGILVIVFGEKYGAAGAAASYLAVVLLVVVPGAGLIWSRCRSEWHRPLEVKSSPDDDTHE